MIQEFHLGACIERKWTQYLEEISAFPSTLQHYSQNTRYGNDHLSTDEWIEKMWYIYNGISFSHKRREILPFTRRNLEDITLSEMVPTSISQPFLPTSFINYPSFVLLQVSMISQPDVSYLLICISVPSVHS